MNLQKKKVLITGASSGLGKELSLILGNAGCDLVLVSNQKEELASLAANIREKETAMTPTTFCIDLEHPCEIETMCKEILATKEYLDILINCAGIIIPERLANVSIENWDKVLAINLTAPFLLVKNFAKSMNEKSEAPLIVNISSKSGKQGGPFCVSYVASKFGLNGLTEAINEEYRINGKLRAISFCPGSIQTPVQDTLNGYPAIAPKPGVDSILNATTSAQLIVDLIRYSDTIDVSELSFQARKSQIYTKKS